ncbi:nuclear pore complex protein NUP50A-like [Aristolochia californica]|uniref:nuclear pore complex protein NUP50A-like n=1 Tax=Aristolochia californica TaxID=171875 RepID=UPI0035DF71E1
MGDSDNALPPSKKRVAGRELSRDNPGLDDEDETPELEAGTFKRASDEVLATRRIVRAKRSQPASVATATPSSNPFANIQLVHSTQTVSDNVSPAQSRKPEEKNETEKESDVKESNGTEKQADTGTGTFDKEKSDSLNEANKPPVGAGEKTESGVEEIKEDPADKASEHLDDDKKSEDAGKGEGTVIKPEEAEKGGDSGKKTETERVESKNDPCVPLSSFQQLSSSQNAFTGLAGTGFSSSSFSFGSFSKDASAFSSSAGPVFGLKNENSSFPSFVIGNSNNGSATRSEGSGIPSMQEVHVETGEENEKAVFTADASLFEYLDGGWKERGKGEVKVNVTTADPKKARLVMRARGNYRLILNASLYPDMKLTNMDKRGITFTCMNSATEGKDGLSTFALRFKDGSVVEEFKGAVSEHKGEKSVSLKTPENSPKASDE